MRIALCFLCLSFCAYADSLQDCYNSCTQLSFEKVELENKLDPKSPQELEKENPDIAILSED